MQVVAVRSKPSEKLQVIVDHFNDVVLATHHLAKW